MSSEDTSMSRLTKPSAQIAGGIFGEDMGAEVVVSSRDDQEHRARPRRGSPPVPRLTLMTNTQDPDKITPCVENIQS